MAHPSFGVPLDKNGNSSESTNTTASSTLAGSSSLPPRFSDVKFTTIGQQPALLNRFSTQDQDQRVPSPTPSVASETGHLSPEMQIPSTNRTRPTLLESLGGLTSGDASPSGDDTAIDSPKSDMDISQSNSPLKPPMSEGIDIFKPVLSFPPSRSQQLTSPFLSLLANPSLTSPSRRDSSPTNPDLLYPSQRSTPMPPRDKSLIHQPVGRASAPFSPTKDVSMASDIQSAETSIQSLYARLHASLVQISPRNLTPARLMVRTCQEGVARSLAAAQKAHTTAQQSLQLAKENACAAQENLTEAESLQLHVEELANALDFQLGEEERDWEVKENVSSVERDLRSFVTLVGQYEAERERRERELERREKEIEDRLVVLNAMKPVQPSVQVPQLPVINHLGSTTTAGPTAHPSVPSRSSSPFAKRIVSSQETAEMEADAARMAWALEREQMVETRQPDDASTSSTQQKPLSPSQTQVKTSSPTLLPPSSAVRAPGPTMPGEDLVAREEFLRKQQAQRKAQMLAAREAELREEQERKRKQVTAAKQRATNETAARIIAERESQKKLATEALGSHNIGSTSIPMAPPPETSGTNTLSQSALAERKKVQALPPGKSIPGPKQPAPPQAHGTAFPPSAKGQQAPAVAAAPEPQPTIRKQVPLTASLADRDVSVPPIAHLPQSTHPSPLSEQTCGTPPSPYRHSDERGIALSFPPTPVPHETQALNLRHVTSPERIKTEPDTEEVLLTSPSSRVRSVQKRPKVAKAPNPSTSPKLTIEPLQPTVTSSSVGTAVAISFPTRPPPLKVNPSLPPKPKPTADVYVAHPLPPVSPISPDVQEDRGLDLPTPAGTGPPKRRPTARKTSGGKPPRSWTQTQVDHYSPPQPQRYRSGSGDSWVAGDYRRSFSPQPFNPRKRGRDFEEEQYPAPSRSRFEDDDDGGRQPYVPSPSPPPQRDGGALAFRLDRQPPRRGDSYVPNYGGSGSGFRRGSPPPQDDMYYETVRPMGRGRAQAPPELLTRMNNGNGHPPPPRGRGRGRGQPGRGRGGPVTGTSLEDRLT